MAIITKLDHYGRGITYINNKITFISGTLIGEDVEYNLTKESKKINEGVVTKINKSSDDRVLPKCPYFTMCGGCHLQHMNYDMTLDFKKNKLQEILSKYANINCEIETIKNDYPFNYRNKISLKVKNYKIGFYKLNSHDLIEVDNCFIASGSINDVIPRLKTLEIKNGDIVVRSNYNHEIMLVINSKDKVNFDIEKFMGIKIVGVIYNDTVIYGEDKFIEIINKKLFQVSYNSFFQVNRNVTSKIFDIVQENITSEDIVADLFCGVGTLSITAATKAKKVYGIEIVSNAIKNALINKKMNKIDNVEFMLGDANKLIAKINDKINTIIVDPPRCGLSGEGLDTILEISPSKLIYISCDPMTLARDLNKLKEIYNIKQVYIADMFSYTYHCETITILNKK